MLVIFGEPVPDNAGRKYDTPGSETKRSSLLKTTAVASVSSFALVPQAPIPKGQYKESQVMLYTEWVTLQEKKAET